MLMERSDEVKLRVKEATDIVALIESYIPLRARGRMLVALCPFHQEKSPSFTVYPETQHFHCYGCKKSGDVFTFVMEREGLGFREALERLADRAGISTEGLFRNERGGPRAPQVDWAGVLGKVRDWFAAALRGPDAGAARAYVAARGLADAVVPFGLGFHPQDSGRLVEFARRERLPLEVLEMAGLVRDGRIEPFRGRLMFPIEDERGRVVGFGGRVLDDSKPKYVNSPESPFFQKRRVLFGLKHVKQAGERRVVVMEGYTDVIAAHLAGFRGAAATLGTALTTDHARTLVRYATDGVVLLFDGDRAGRQAAEKAFRELAASELPLRIALLPEGLDPADALSRRPGSTDADVEAGRARFRSWIDAADDALTAWFRLLRQRLDLSNDAAVARVLDECAEVLGRLDNPARRALLVSRMAAQLGLDPETFHRSVKQRARVGKSDATPRADAVGSVGTDAPPIAAPTEAQLDVLACVLREPQTIDDVTDASCGHDDVDAVLAAVRVAAAAGILERNAVVARLFTEFTEQPRRRSLVALVVDRAAVIRDARASLQQSLRVLRAGDVRRVAQQLRLKMQEAAAAGDQPLVDRLTREYLEHLRRN